MCVPKEMHIARVAQKKPLLGKIIVFVHNFPKNSCLSPTPPTAIMFSAITLNKNLSNMFDKNKIVYANTNMILLDWNQFAASLCV